MWDVAGVVVKAPFITVDTGSVTLQAVPEDGLTDLSTPDTFTADDREALSQSLGRRH